MKRREVKTSSVDVKAVFKMVTKLNLSMNFQSKDFVKDLLKRIVTHLKDLLFLQLEDGVGDSVPE
jgi:hypothetical protein